MATKCSILPLAVIWNNDVYRNHILTINNDSFSLIPFEQECEATRFISAIIILANDHILSHISTLPKIGERYENIPEVIKYLNQHNLFAKKNEGLTLISASPSKYSIL